MGTALTWRLQMGTQHPKRYTRSILSLCDRQTLQGAAWWEMVELPWGRGMKVLQDRGLMGVQHSQGNSSPLT